MNVLKVGEKGFYIHFCSAFLYQVTLDSTANRAMQAIDIHQLMEDRSPIASRAIAIIMLIFVIRRPDDASVITILLERIASFAVEDITETLWLVSNQSPCRLTSF